MGSLICVILWCPWADIQFVPAHRSKLGTAFQVEKGCQPKQPPDYSKSLEISKTPNMGWGNQSKFDYK